MKKIAFAGTDGRTLLWAYVTSTATSEIHWDTYEGFVVRGTPAMPAMVNQLNWPVTFIPTASNSVDDYAAAIIEALSQNRVDYVVPMPEGLLFDGLVDKVNEAGFGDRIMGLAKAGAFIEGDKLACKKLCMEAGIAVADNWAEVDARDYDSVLQFCLDYIDRFGGAVLKYPYSAGGKGARVIHTSWQIREVYDTLMNDYRANYKKLFRKNRWPLLIESLMAGIEISFTLLVDGNGAYQILPTSMDYPERFAAPPGPDNPITGGTGAVSPHPMETPELMRMAGETIAEPLIAIMQKKGILRPSILYPGCFVSFNELGQPTRIRVSEINIRPGEPEAQPVARRLRNLGPMIAAAMEGRLDEVPPEVRDEQVAICIALMTGPGGPDGQKGYPWSCTRGEVVEIDLKYLNRKGIQLIPSAMAFMDDAVYKSDGTRVAFINANATVKEGAVRGEVADRLARKLLAAYKNGKVRVIPREDANGNRLALREDIGHCFALSEKIFTKA